MRANHVRIWLILFSVVLLWSAIRPHDYFTWLLEVFPALIGVVVLAFTFKTFPLTPLAYWLILIHACILMVGGHYTYAEVPLFNWIRETLHHSRNNYDKVGHFAQGFIPAIVAREILIRVVGLKQRGWLFFLVVCVCLAVSAFYELIEWWVALGTGESAEGFLGTQGDVWDTQSDMMLAMVGAAVSLILLSKLHEKQLSELAWK
jgi:putative membrane protein